MAVSSELWPSSNLFLQGTFMRKFLSGLSIAVASSLAFAGPVLDGSSQVKAVYHINSNIESAAQSLGNINNHLNADPTAKIVVVTHSLGIDFLLSGAKDSKGREFAGTVSTLAGRGVEFRVCNNTLVNRKIDPAKLLLETKIVPSGVSEVALLQQKYGYSYVKP